jgi:tetratricopeptide (TPR) repeat protein
MKNIIILLCILLLVPLAPVVYAADEVGGIENIFSFGAGLRAIGMGTAFIAMTDDPTLAYWNPGAMAFNQYKEISIFGSRTFAETYYFAGFYSNPTVNIGTLSVGALGIYTNGIESFDENASPITGASTSSLNYQILLSYGYNFRWGLGVGATAKVEQLRITDSKGTGASFDVGVYYNIPKLSWLSVAAVVQDVYGTGIKLEDEFEKATRTYKLGVASNFNLKNEKYRLSIAMDSRFFKDNFNPTPGELLWDLSLGSEFALADTLMFRLGYRNFTFSDAFQNFPERVSVGVGVRRWGFGVDYAVSFEDSDFQGPLELLMRLGISYRFGTSMDEKKKKQAEDIRKQIDDGIREATAEFEDKLANLEDQYTRDKEQIERGLDEKYEQQIAELDKGLEESKQEIDRITAQLETEKQTSLEELTNQYQQEKSAIEQQLSQDRAQYEAQIARLEQQFEAEKNARQKLAADEAFKSERYALGLQLYADGDFEQALAEFETVARFDSGYLKVQEYIQLTKAEMRDVTTYSPEILNLYFNGIDLFVQKKYEEAITEWNKILEIDPYNKLALRNIKEAKSRLRRLKELGISE